MHIEPNNTRINFLLLGRPLSYVEAQEKMLFLENEKEFCWPYGNNDFQNPSNEWFVTFYVKKYI